MSIREKRHLIPIDAAMRDAAARWVARRDAGLTEADQREFASWLAENPAHAAALSTVDSAWAALDRPYLAGAGAEFLRTVEVRRKQRLRRRLTGWGATVAIAVAIGFVIRDRPPETIPASEAPAAALQSIVHFPRGEDLPDGSRIEFKEGTRFNVEFRPEVRRIVLARGEAHFDVTKDPLRPFVVDTGGIAIRAVGTAFAVQAGEQAVEVLVTEGRVAVETHFPAGPAGEPEAGGATGPGETTPVATLDAGTLIVLDRANAPEQSPPVSAVTPTEIRERMAWRAPRVEFTRTPLSEAIELLNRYAATRGGRQFMIEDPAIEKVLVGGLFRVDNTDAFVELLRSGFGIEAHARDETTFVLRRSGAFIH